MAKRRVRISLATKLRLMFALAVLIILSAAVAVPWYFMELLAEQGLQRPGSELTRLRLNEWLQEHPKDANATQDKRSRVVALYASAGAEPTRTGPAMVILGADGKPSRPLDSPARKAHRAFQREPELEMAILRDEDDRGRAIYRCFRPLRAEPTCMTCHGQSAKAGLQFRPGQLKGLIDVSLPAEAASGPLVWWTRGAFLAGVALAALLAFFLFTVITQRLVLGPVRRLRDLADKVAEGDLSVRSTIQTGDELQRLGESFNEMLSAIREQHEKLRAANRALDLKLSELAEANVALFQANRVKIEFLANVSHELRTPLNSIIGFADLLAERDEERTRRYGQNIAASARSLLGMINDLLDMAKIEAGKADVRFDKVNVTDACRTLAALMAPLADKKHLALRTDLAADVPLVVTDAGKLQQILFNLLSNAVKFTPAGGQVTLSTRLHPASRDGRPADEVSVTVADTGPGIPESEQQRIFEKFYQVDQSLTKGTYGTGLGLAIARDLTQLLGGRLTLVSSPGQGAAFTLWLPLEPPAPAQPPTRPAAG